jgi:hypothetical protein
MSLAINRPDVVASVRVAFARYESALVAHDVDQLVRSFWADERTVRFGIAESTYGFDAISAWRRAASPVPPYRELRHTVVTSFGDDVAVVDAEFVGGDASWVGRQSQTWVRFAGDWRIVSAHVSVIPAP